jgi:succinate dehydrogenase / fumarate reductase membrane anchor subunit
MSLRSPLARARGLGSAKEGTAHWWQQRVTAIALIPLSIWFIASAIGLAGSHYEHFQLWISIPGNAVLMLLMLLFLFHHAQLGLQVVIEDYVHDRGAQIAMLLLVKGTCLLLGVFSAFAVLRTALIGG